MVVSRESMIFYGGGEQIMRRAPNGPHSFDEDPLQKDPLIPL